MNPSVEGMLLALTRFGKVEITERVGRYKVVLSNYDGDESADAPTLLGAVGVVYHAKREKVVEASRNAAQNLSIFHAVEGTAGGPPS